MSKIYRLTTENADGQPLSPSKYISENWIHKTTDELTGFIQGICADGELTNKEVIAVYEYLASRPDEELNQWPICDIASRVFRILEDGKITEEEMFEAAELFRAILGGCFDPAKRGATQLPVDNPSPIITYTDCEFCLTGKFVFGPRKKIGDLILEKGGTLTPSPRIKTDFLIIGELASRDWKNTSYGTKIEKAVQLREKHKTIAIVSEEAWRITLGDLQ